MRSTLYTGGNSLRNLFSVLSGELKDGGGGSSRGS